MIIKATVNAPAATGRGCVITFLSASGAPHRTGNRFISEIQKSADMLTNFGFSVYVRTSILIFANRVYTCWARRRPLMLSAPRRIDL